MTCWYETEARVRGVLDCELTCPPAPPPTPAPAASGGACDAIEVAGTDYGLLTRFAYDGLYEEAGACNGLPYYKCTCCTAYDPANDVDDPDECLSEKNFHHYVWYDGAAWQLRLYAGGAGEMYGWDECGDGGWAGSDEYRRVDPDGDLAAATDGGVTVVKALAGTTCGEGDAAGRKVLAPSALAGTRCCGSIYDSFCNDDNDGCLNGAAPGYVTYEVAKATCEDAGARLCTPDELNLHYSEGGVVGTGCNFDLAYAWSSEAGDASGWEKQATDFAGGDMLYVWNDHAMTATCVAASSASAASAGFSAILAGERGTPLQALLLLALIVAALLGVCCCYFSAKAVSGMMQASNAGPKKKRAAMALPRKVATVPGYELLGSPGPALAGHERTFFVRLPADARAGSQVKCSTPTGAPVFFRAPPGAGPGQTVYIPWYAPGEATVKAVAKPPRYRSALAPPPPPSPVPVKVLAPPPAPATAAPHVASVKIKAPAPHVTSVKIKAPAPHVASVKVKAPAPHVASVKIKAPPPPSKTAAAPPPPPPPGMVDLVVPPKAVPGFTRVTRDLPDGRSVEGVVPKGAQPGDHFHVPLPPAHASPAAAATTGGTTMITVPPGCKPGDALAFTLTDGRQMSLTVPDGARPGDRLSVPNASAAATGGSMTITLPDGARPGDRLQIPLADGTSMELTVPEGSQPGDSLSFSTEQAPPAPAPAAKKGGWFGGREKPATSTVMVTVPEGAHPGDQLQIPLPDGTSLAITLPEGARPGDNLEVPTGGAQTAPPPPKAEAPPTAKKPAPKAAPAAKKAPPKRAPPPPIAAPAMGADGIPVGSPGPGMAGSPRTFHMKLPADARRGQKIQVRAPSGELMVFKVPRNARPGQTLHFPY